METARPAKHVPTALRIAERVPFRAVTPLVTAQRKHARIAKPTATLVRRLVLMGHVLAQKRVPPVLKTAEHARQKNSLRRSAEFYKMERGKIQRINDNEGL